MTPQERIKADAEAYVAKTRGQQGRVETYIAGATAVHDRAQVLVDALDQFISYHETGLLPARHVYEKAVAAREQWKSGKGKEVENPCPNCGKELSKDRHGCCRECGAFEFNNPQQSK